MITLDLIIQSTNRSPFNKSDVNVLTEFLKREERNHLIVRLSEIMVGERWGSINACLNDGIIIISCPQIQSDIVYAKCTNGKNLFGKEKYLFANYLGSVNHDEFEIGASHKMFLMGLTGINNIFRANGFLKGGAY